MTVVCKVTGTFSEEMVLPDGTAIPGTGKYFELDFSTTAKWEEELLVEEYMLLHSVPMIQQIPVV